MVEFNQAPLFLTTNLIIETEADTGTRMSNAHIAVNGERSRAQINLTWRVGLPISSLSAQFSSQPEAE